MINIFNDIRRAYYIVSVAGAMVIGASFAWAGIPAWVVLIAAIAWVLFCTKFFGARAKKRVVAIGNNRANCNVTQYIRDYDKLLKEQKPGSLGEGAIKLNLAAGLMDIGDFDGAARMMATANLESRDKKNRKSLNALYHNGFASIFTRKGEFDKAKQAVESCRRAVDELEAQFGNKGIAHMRNYIKIREAQLAIAEGDISQLDNAEKVMFDYLNMAKTKLERVGASYWLARLYYTKGNKQEERRCLAFVAENGGDTIYGMEAKDILEAYARHQLEETNESL